MALYLFSPAGQPIQPVPLKGHFRLPNGDVVSPAVEGYVAKDGHFLADHTPVIAPDPVADQAALEEWRATAEISQLQAHYTLFAWGILDAVTAMVQQLGNPLQMAFERAGTWRRSSPSIIALFSKVTMPDGTVPTPEVVDEFFRQAERFSL